MSSPVVNALGLAPTPEASSIATDALVGKLLEDFGTDAEPVVINLDNGVTLTFKKLQTYAEVNRFNKAAAQFVLKMRNRARLQLTEPHLAELAPDDDDSAVAAFTFAELSLEPKFTIEQGLKLLNAPWFAPMVLGKLNSERMNYLRRQALEAIDEKKGDSEKTPSGETS